MEEYVVHAGVSWSNRVINKMRLRMLFTPQVGIYFPTAVYKDKALCGTLITTYCIESVFVNDNNDDDFDFKNENKLIAISWRKGDRPVYYTDLWQMPRCNHLETKPKGPDVSCPMWIDDSRYALWDLAKTDLV